MEDADKMTALKKAYAEIILNMAQESAARILVSERKALGFQRSLFTSKEEALSTLLRVKTVMESKIKEAEMASLGQVRRIQELEYQLSEAADTIHFLRMELERMNNELGKVRNNLSKSLDEEAKMDDTVPCEDRTQGNKSSSHPVVHYPNGPELVLAEKDSIILSQQATNDNCCGIENVMKAEVMDVENECGSNADLASIIMRSKEPELYRNGCTQRIRAFEQNLLTARVPTANTDNQSSKSTLVGFENGDPQRTFVADSTKVGKPVLGLKDAPGSQEIVEQSNTCRSGQLVKFFRRFSSRNYGKGNHIKSTYSGTSNQDILDHAPSHINYSSISGEGKLTGPDKELFQVDGEELKKISNSHALPVIVRCCKRPKTNQIHPKMYPQNERSGQLKSNKGRVTRHSLTEQTCLNFESQTCASALDGSGNEHVSSVATSTEEEDDVVSTGDQKHRAYIVKAEGSVLASRAKGVAAENKDSSTCELKLEKGDLPKADSGLTDEQTHESSRSPQGPGSDMFLKYTFRRKRKRGNGSSKYENILPEKKNTSKRRTGDKKNSSLESQKPSLAVESTRDSRRMAQVARQLISLSEKRWW